MMFEKKITQFEKEVLLQEKLNSSKTSLKNFLIFKKKCTAKDFKKASWVWKIESSELRKCFIQTESLSGSRGGFPLLMNFQRTFRCFESGVSPLHYRKAKKPLLSCAFCGVGFRPCHLLFCVFKN